MAKKELVAELSQSEFSKAINDKKHKLVIVDFYAEWCFPCTMMAPVMERMAEKNPSIKFAKINMDHAGNLAQEYEISSIPCIIFFKDGKEVDRIAESVSEDILKEKIYDYLKLE
jgi:thioredoxin 1